MLIFDTFSKRKKRAEETQPDVYKYDELPIEFRRQVVLILLRAIGPYNGLGYYLDASEKLWSEIFEIARNEFGTFSLGTPQLDPCRQCQELIQEGTTDRVLDIIEIAFRGLKSPEWGQVLSEPDPPRVQAPLEAIAELNHRFAEHSLGYAFEGMQLVRKDSEYVHAEIVRPALSLLSDPEFAGPQEEFLKAHEHLRKGDYKEAINWAGKSFESTLKTICDLQGWKYSTSDTSFKLIEIVLQNDLVPQYLQSHLTALRSVLESGVPTIRNQSTSSHGQGATPSVVRQELAAFAIDMTAANIVFLVQSHKPLS